MAGYKKGKCACGNWQTSKGRVNGRQYYDRYCTTCKRSRRRGQTKQKKLVCQICGFRAKYPAQIDIDHIDGNHLNESPENLQEICANCHRLKTIENEDWLRQRGVDPITRTSKKWIGRYAREYLRSIGFEVSDRGGYSKEMLEALERANIPKGKQIARSKKKSTVKRRRVSSQ